MCPGTVFSSFSKDLHRPREVNAVIKNFIGVYISFALSDLHNFRRYRTATLYRYLD